MLIVCCFRIKLFLSQVFVIAAIPTHRDGPLTIQTTDSDAVLAHCENSEHVRHF